jgi:thioredoxin reductase
MSIDNRVDPSGTIDGEESDAKAASSPTSSEPSHATWLVIGAGPSGLSVGAQLARRGIDFVIAESGDGVGGIWNIGAPDSPAYESVHFISSKKLSGFPGFPMPDDYPDYPSGIQIRDYLRAYSAHHGLEKHLRLHHRVAKLEPKPTGGFAVTFSISGQGEARSVTEYFAGVIVANGHLRAPNRVTFPGSFDGEVIHSFDYKKREQLTDKRVLVVGVGNSGCDIAVDATSTAKTAFISTRRGVWFVPKYILGKPADEFAEGGPHLPKKIEKVLVWPIFEKLSKWLAGDPVRFGLPAPKHRVLDEIPVVNTQLLYMLGHGRLKAKPAVSRLDGDGVVFADGSRETIDLIVTATGYKVDFPFCDSGLLHERSGFELPLKIQHPTNNDLLVAGLTEGIGPGYPTYDNAAKLVATYVVAHGNGTAALQSLRTRIIEADKNVAKMKDSQGLLVDLEAYNKALVALSSSSS